MRNWIRNLFSLGFKIMPRNDPLFRVCAECKGKCTTIHPGMLIEMSCQSCAGLGGHWIT